MGAVLVDDLIHTVQGKANISTIATYNQSTKEKLLKHQCHTHVNNYIEADMQAF
jgi:hypothetical protein